MIYVLYIVFVCLWPSVSVGEDAYTLLWKRSFDSSIIKISRIEDFVTRDSAFPLNHIVSKKNLIKLNINTTKEKILPLKTCDIVKVADNDCIAVGLKKNVFTVFTTDKQISTFKTDNTVVIPEHLIIDISPDGSIIVILSWFHKSVSFYTINGQLLNRYSAEDLKGAVIQFSRNSERVVIHAPNYGDGSSNGYMLCYDKKGQLLWRYDHPGCQAQYDLSSDGEYVILYANQKLYSVHKGKMIYEKNMNSPEILARISNDGKHVALARKSDHCILYIDNHNGKTLWKQTISGFDSLNSPFTDMEIRQNVIAIAVSKHWSRRNAESWMIVFNTKGKRIWDKKFEHNALKVFFSNRASTLGLFAEKAVYLYRRHLKAN